MKHIKPIYEYGIRDEYAKIGVKNFYKINKTSYINPHIKNVHLALNWVLSKIEMTSVIDLAAGTGEITSYLFKNGITDSIGIDPYLFDIYEKNTGKKCFNFSFEDIAINGLNMSKQTIVCSYALHLCPKSYFDQLIYNLSLSCEYFILISPSKYPIVDKYFELIDDTIINRTHCKIFKSIL